MSANTQRYLFYIQGIKCTNCIAKIRSHINEKHKEAKGLKLNLSQSSLGFSASDSFPTDVLKNELSQLGFKATEVDEASQKKDHKDLAERRDFLMRLGVAGACTGNSMLVSFALYLGADQTEFKSFLSWAAFVFYLPIVFYSARPLLEGAFRSLKSLKPSIDVPIALAIVFGGVLSLYTLAIGKNEFYFDSLSMLVFLILCTRFLVFTIRQNHLTPLSLVQFFKSEDVSVITKDNEQILKSIDDVKPGDIVLLEKGQSSPFDAELIDEAADFDTSILTGESYPQTLKKHDQLFAGSVSLNNDVLIHVNSGLHESRFSKILDSINQLIHEKNQLVTITDKGAQALTYIILAVSFVFLIFPGSLDLHERVIRVLALLVIACPCALAIATPLALSLTVRGLFKKDILIKNLDAFSLLKKITCIVFDKTGTLTDGTLNLTDWSPREPDNKERSLIYSMETQSGHPIAKAILRALKKPSETQELTVVEKPGVGVFANFRGDEYSLEQSLSSGFGVDFKKNGSVVLSASFDSKLKEDSRRTIENLSDIGISSYLLTGDKKEEALSIGKRLGLTTESTLFERSPEEKLIFIKSLKNKKHSAIYIGDGLNDCLAMTQAPVSVSVHSSLEETFKASDVHFLKPGVSKVLDLIQSSKKLYLLLKTNLTISFIYNITFGALALSGFITPFLTAIIMPVSSFLVVGLTFFMLKNSDKQ